MIIGGFVGNLVVKFGRFSLFIIMVYNIETICLVLSNVRFEYSNDVFFPINAYFPVWFLLYECPQFYLFFWHNTAFCHYYTHCLAPWLWGHSTFLIYRSYTPILTLNHLILSWNLISFLQIMSYLEQRFYRELRNEQLHSVKVIICICRKLLSSCKEQMWVPYLIF